MSEVYTRSNAVPNQEIQLRTSFSRYGQPFAPYSVGPVRITKVDPRSGAYNPSTDLLETIPSEAIGVLGVGIYRYTVSPTTITEIGTYFDAVTFKFDAEGPEMVLVNTFQVTTTGIPKVGYITVQDLRDEGLTDTDKYSDALLSKRIAHWSRQIESWLGRWFEPRTLIFDVDGQGAYEMQLDFPILSISEITLLDSYFPHERLYNFNLQDVKVYNRHISQQLINPDDREDPRLGGVYWPKGRQNIRINGVFGYTDLTGSTPLEIQRVVALLVLRDKEKLAAANRKNSLLSGLAGYIIEESTDDHSYKVGAPVRSLSSTMYFTGDAEIDQILTQYYRPIKLGKNLGASVSLRDHGTDFYTNSSGFGFQYGRAL